MPKWTYHTSAGVDRGDRGESVLAWLFIMFRYITLHSDTISVPFFQPCYASLQRSVRISCDRGMMMSEKGAEAAKQLMRARVDASRWSIYKWCILIFFFFFSRHVMRRTDFESNWCLGRKKLNKSKSWCKPGCSRWCMHRLVSKWCTSVFSR